MKDEGKGRNDKMNNKKKRGRKGGMVRKETKGNGTGRKVPA